MLRHLLSLEHNTISALRKIEKLARPTDDDLVRGVLAHGGADVEAFVLPTGQALAAHVTHFAVYRGGREGVR